jgi:hypothetical protein
LIWRRKSSGSPRSLSGLIRFFISRPMIDILWHIGRDMP